jgi:hypothetical protein
MPLNDGPEKMANVSNSKCRRSQKEPKSDFDSTGTTSRLGTTPKVNSNSIRIYSAQAQFDSNPWSAIPTEISSMPDSPRKFISKTNPIED